MKPSLTWQRCSYFQGLRCSFWVEEEPGAANGPKGGSGGLFLPHPALLLWTRSSRGVTSRTVGSITYDYTECIHLVTIVRTRWETRRESNMT